MMLRASTSNANGVFVPLVEENQENQESLDILQKQNQARPNPLLDWMDENLVSGGKAEEPAGEAAGILFETDLYDAVVVAAFGGVTVNLEKNKSVKVHPFWMLLCCIPLFLIQNSILFFLKLDMPRDWPAIRDSDNDERHIIFCMKLLLVFVVQATIFSEILGALRLLTFLVNPTTWQDIKRVDPESFGPGWLKGSLLNPYQSWFVAPWAILSMLFKLGIGYLVCVDSVSIILQSDGVKDAIFNSLAIGFIADLDETGWSIMQPILNLDDFDEYEFRIASVEFRRKSREKFIRWPLVLRRGFGARFLENTVTKSLTALIYFRQLAVVIYAIDTNILPMARDVCTYWRWASGNAISAPKGFARLIMHFFLHNLVIIDSEEALDDKGDPDAHPSGMCHGEFLRMKTSDVWAMSKKHPYIIWGGWLFIAAVFLLPSSLTKVAQQLKDKVVVAAEEAQEEQPEKADVNKVMRPKDELASMRKKIKRLEEQVAQLTMLMTNNPDSPSRSNG
eukprot:gnl/TRDRNA2_/TRDRNA2_141670_c0_seq1.p1 gnl/TRDRNA2_/TRDRNA2_141670_c0~~gnl/TRDRNA2_/TRDRNA2_141670_c0_seq1.p1  ORF type:complete len:506 (+),score=92.66 gnl/TRDRNA2_/TRDRNA2_141670_c0_seq1:51-1568(+)